MPIDLYLTAAEHIVYVAELVNLELQTKENSEEAYLLRNRLSLADEILQNLPKADINRVHSFETLLTSKMKATPSKAESYLKVACYIRQDTLLCKMIAEKNDEKEADDLRNAMDETFRSMAEDEEFKIHVDGLEGLHGWIGNSYGIWNKQ